MSTTLAICGIGALACIAIIGWCALQVAGQADDCDYGIIIPTDQEPH